MNINMFKTNSILIFILCCLIVYFIFTKYEINIIDIMNDYNKYTLTHKIVLIGGIIILFYSFINLFNIKCDNTYENFAIVDQNELNVIDDKIVSNKDRVIFTRFICTLPIIENGETKNKEYYLATMPKSRCKNIIDKNCDVLTGEDALNQQKIEEHNKECKKQIECSDTLLVLVEKKIMDEEYAIFKNELMREELLCNIKKNINDNCTFNKITNSEEIKTLCSDSTDNSTSDCFNLDKQCLKTNKDCKFLPRYYHDFVITKAIVTEDKPEKRYRINGIGNKMFTTNSDGGISISSIIPSKKIPFISDVKFDNFICGVNTTSLSPEDFYLNDIYIDYTKQTETVGNDILGTPLTNENTGLDIGISAKVSFKLPLYENGQEVVILNKTQTTKYYFGYCDDSFCDDSDNKKYKRVCLYKNEALPNVLSFKIIASQY
jgi:hypothetical protein